MDRSLDRAWNRKPPLIVGVAAILALLLVVGLALWRISAQSAVKPINLATLRWIFYKEDLNRLRKADPALIDTMLSGPGTYALEQSAAGALPSGAIPAQTFFSYTDFQSAIQNGTVIPGVRAVLDDPEGWAATPVAEQQDPLPAMQLFGQAAQANGYTGILAPGRDLMQVPGGVCTKRQPSDTLSQAYIYCGIPAAAAYAPVFVIQSAAVETNQAQLTQLVQAAAAQALAANPNVVVLATISSTAGGSPVDPSVLTQAARSILPYVHGLLLNSTQATDPAMLSFLHALAAGS